MIPSYFGKFGLFFSFREIIIDLKLFFDLRIWLKTIFSVCHKTCICRIQLYFFKRATLISQIFNFVFFIYEFGFVFKIYWWVGSNLFYIFLFKRCSHLIKPIQPYAIPYLVLLFLKANLVLKLNFLFNMLITILNVLL